MRSFRKAFPSKFLKADDLTESSIVATIARVELEDIGQGENVSRKLVAHFTEPGVKPFALNVVNAETIAELAGSEDIDRWPGTEIELFRTRTFFQGQRVPCVRIRAPQGTDAREPQAAHKEI